MPSPQYGKVLESGTIWNTGTTPLTFGGSPRLTFTGTNAGDISAINTDLPATLAVGASAGVSFYFSPQGIYTRTAVPTVTDTSSGSTLYLQNPFTAQATNPLPVASVSSLTFPPTHLNQTSATMSLVIYATGVATGDTLTVTTGPKFAVSPTTCAGGGPCQINVTYTPTTLGTANSGQPTPGMDTATLNVFDATANTTTQVPLSGTPGIGSAIILTTTLNFGTVAVGTASPSQALTLYNGGDGYLVYTLPYLPNSYTGPNPSTAASPDFSTSAFGTVYTSIAPNSSLSIAPTVFKPTAVGVRDSTLTLTTLPAANLSVLLKGTGY